MGEREKTCAERIGEQLHGRLEDFARIANTIALGDDEKMEDAMQEASEYPLAVSMRQVIRVELSTGGPGDWLEYLIDPQDNNNCERITYHFQDWFDHAEQTLHDDKFDTAEEFGRTLGIFE